VVHIVLDDQASRAASEPRTLWIFLYVKHFQRHTDEDRCTGCSPVMVVGGLAAFVITQANADKSVTADAENVEEPTEDQPLDIERVSSITPLSADQIQVPQLMEITVGKDTKEVLTTGDTVQDVLGNANV